MSAFDWLLAFYPRSFRDRHGEGLRECWEDQVQEQGQTRAAWDLFHGAFVAQWQAAHEPVALVLAQGGSLSIQQKARVGGQEFLQQALITLSIGLLVSFLGFRFFAPAFFEGDVWMGLAAVGSLIGWQIFRPYAAPARPRSDAVLACQNEGALLGAITGISLGLLIFCILLPVSVVSSSLGASPLLLDAGVTNEDLDLAFLIFSALWIYTIGLSFESANDSFSGKYGFRQRVERNLPFFVNFIIISGLAFLCYCAREPWVISCAIGFLLIGFLIRRFNYRLFIWASGIRFGPNILYPMIFIALGLLAGLKERLSDPVLVGVQQRIEMSLTDLEQSQDQAQFWKRLQHEQQAWITGAGLTT